MDKLSTFIIWAIERKYPVVLVWLAIVLGFFSSPWALVSQHWFVTPIAFLAASFANATAVGGGFLFIPLFIFAYALPPLTALKLSLATQAFGMSCGALGWSAKQMSLKALGFACMGGAIGMYIGTFHWQPDGRLIKVAFAYVSFFIALVILIEIVLSMRAKHRNNQRPSNGLLNFVFFMVCIVAGVVNAWVSVCIGEVVVLWLLIVQRVRMEQAIATGVACLAFCSIIGLAFHSFIGGIRWDLLVFTVPGVIFGGYYGARWGKRMEHRFGQAIKTSVSAYSIKQVSPLKCIFLVVVLLDGIIILLSS